MLRSVPLVFLILWLCRCTPTTNLNDEKIYWQEDSVSWVEVKDGKFGLVMDGAVTIEPKYQIENLDEMIVRDGYCYFSDGAHFALGLDGKWGVLDNHGTEIVPFQYDYVRIQRGDDSYGKMEFAGVEKNGKCAIMDASGKLITGYDYDAFYGYYRNEGFLAHDPKLIMRLGDKVVFYDPLTKTDLAKAPAMEFGVASKVVDYKSKQGVITQTGEILLDLTYDHVYFASDNAEKPMALAVGNKGEYGLWILGKGVVLPLGYEGARVEYCYDKMYFVVTRNEKEALLDDQGKNLTGFEYDYFTFYPEEIVGVKEAEDYNIGPGGKATGAKR